MNARARAAKLAAFLPAQSGNESGITMPVEIVGQIVHGSFSELVVREKDGSSVELGDLFVAETDDGYALLECFDLVYGSQLGDATKELISGMSMSGYELELYEPHLANYTLALLKMLVAVRGEKAFIPKKLPKFFSHVRRIEENDLAFLSKPGDALCVGKLRSGSKRMAVDVHLEGEKVLRHHVLVAATTGRGKSNLVKVLAQSAMRQSFCSLLVLDAHDEYYGRNGSGLKQCGKCVYYSMNPLPGGYRLVINIRKLWPSHLDDMFGFSDAQSQAMHAYAQRYGKDWIKELVAGGMEEQQLRRLGVRPDTLVALRRKFAVFLGIHNVEGELRCAGLFDMSAGEATIEDICSSLEAGAAVVIDTSLLGSDLELLAGSMVAKEIFARYKRYKLEGTLDSKPVVSIILEEAPRVLNNDAMERGNIFATVAREGRKFGVGLIAITQLPSLIPREILANMNTKIILGTELAAERTALIESAAQDLSKDDRNIASLDVGEAIITSNFTKFAMPVAVPLFEPAAEPQSAPQARKGFAGF